MSEASGPLAEERTAAASELEALEAEVAELRCVVHAGKLLCVCLFAISKAGRDVAMISRTMSKQSAPHVC